MFRCWDTRAEILMFFGSGFMPYLDCFKGLGWWLETMGSRSLEVAGMVCSLSHGRCSMGGFCWLLWNS